MIKMSSKHNSTHHVTSPSNISSQEIPQTFAQFLRLQNFKFAQFTISPSPSPTINNQLFCSSESDNLILRRFSPLSACLHHHLHRYWTSWITVFFSVVRRNYMMKHGRKKERNRILLRIFSHSSSNIKINISYLLRCFSSSFAFIVKLWGIKDFVRSCAPGGPSSCWMKTDSST